jgi:hypothetical protein
MNIRKSRLWLALTGWLPWSCYFGLHYWITLYRTYSGMSFLEKADGSCHLINTNASFVPVAKCCKRCGEQFRETYV